MVGFILVLAALAMALQSGCSQDEPEKVRTSRRGETCRVTNDCSEGLSCAPIPGGAGGICVTGEFQVRPTAKECALVECTSGADCCDASLTAGCAQLRSVCLADAGTQSALACAQYDAQCGCDTGTTSCQAGRCVSRCDTDSDCLGSGKGRRCSGGACVQCASDPDCGPGKQCVTGACQAPCTNDGDCPGFDRCLEGRCISSGCQSDRECVASTRNVDARCGTDGKCIVPCETDLECGNPTSYAFFSCIARECTYVGCEADKDCGLFYRGQGLALGDKQHVVCRDRGIGDVVKSGP